MDDHPDHWILDENHEPQPADFLTWSRWCDTHDIWIDVDRIRPVYVHTMFAGFDPDFTGEGQPLLYETRVYGGGLDEIMDRYPTWNEASRGHFAAVLLVRDARRRNQLQDLAGWPDRRTGKPAPK